MHLVPSLASQNDSTEDSFRFAYLPASGPETRCISRKEKLSGKYRCSPHRLNFEDFTAAKQTIGGGCCVWWKQWVGGDGGCNDHNTVQQKPANGPDVQRPACFAMSLQNQVLRVFANCRFTNCTLRGK